MFLLVIGCPRALPTIESVEGVVGEKSGLNVESRRGGKLIFLRNQKSNDVSKSDVDILLTIRLPGLSDILEVADDRSSCISHLVLIPRRRIRYAS